MPTHHTGWGPDRPGLRRAIEGIAGSGFLGAQLRVNDASGEWVAAGPGS
ncbi:hypothetical protein [Kitasatospora sp. NPDC001547]|nr:hypothetical protein KitaXyl93_72220 [Kitasatospora sp. Xyl93]